MVEIIVDQSHCNYHLCLWLESQGGIILFRDAGRVTRGGKGTQRELLHLFESRGLPIPDIVAILNDRLYIIEIDSLTSKALKSLHIYKKNEISITQYINYIYDVKTLRSMQLAFCKTGITDLSRRSFFEVTDNGFDYIYFNAPRSVKYIDK